MTEKRLCDDDIEDLEKITYSALKIFKKMGMKIVTRDGIDLTEKIEDFEDSSDKKMWEKCEIRALI